MTHAVHNPESGMRLPDAANFRECSQWLQQRYLKSSRDDDFIDALSEILETDNEGNLTAEPVRFGLGRETRGLMVLGASGSGKSMLVKRNLKREPAIGVSEYANDNRALYHLVRPEATAKSVAIKIAEATNYVIRETVRTHEAWDIAMHRLASSGISILWIDECHHLLRRARGRDADMILQRLKSIMQGPKALALIVSGVPELNENILRDPETSRRFSRVQLHPVKTAQELANLARYIEMCCAAVGVTLIDDRNFFERLLFANHGSLGNSIEQTLNAIRRALRRPDRRLTLQDLRRVHELKTGAGGPNPFDDEPWPDLQGALEKIGWAA